MPRPTLVAMRSAVAWAMAWSGAWTKPEPVEIGSCRESGGNYFVAMLTKIVPIGNSRGIRIPKAMLEHCGFGEEVDLQAKNGALILRPFSAPRAGWAEAFGGMAAAKDDRLAHEDAPTATRFDAEEWKW